MAGVEEESTPDEQEGEPAHPLAISSATTPDDDTASPPTTGDEEGAPGSSVGSSSWWTAWGATIAEPPSKEDFVKLIMGAPEAYRSAALKPSFRNKRKVT